MADLDHAGLIGISAADGAKVEVVGPLKKNGNEFFREVRTAAINSVAV